MTVHVLAQVGIGELDRFLEVFSTDGLAKRAEHGCLGTDVFVPLGGTGEVVVLLEFPDEAAAEGFRTDASAAPVMRKGGAQGPPSSRYLEKVASYEH